MANEAPLAQSIFTSNSEPPQLRGRPGLCFYRRSLSKRRLPQCRPTTQHDNNGPDTELDTPIWGVKFMAPVINRTERDTRHLIKNKRLDVTQKGNLYVSTRRRLLASLGVK